MTSTPGGTNILMYHSIGPGPGPLSIPVQTFRRQLDGLSACGFRAVSLREYIADRPHASPDDRCVVLTFDDGTRDFVETAAPEIASRGWGCTVFLSSGLVGSSTWNPDGRARRPLLGWQEASSLAAAGVEVGAHGIAHADLTTLTEAAVAEEIANSRQTIEERVATRVTSFAAPYGRTTAAIREVIARHYDCAVGTTLAPATLASDRYDLPRIEMWYFRNAARWRSFLQGATAYLGARRAIRRVRSAVGRST